MSAMQSDQQQQTNSLGGDRLEGDQDQNSKKMNGSSFLLNPATTTASTEGIFYAVSDLAIGGRCKCKMNNKNFFEDLKRSRIILFIKIVTTLCLHETRVSTKTKRLLRIT